MEPTLLDAVTQEKPFGRMTQVGWQSSYGELLNLCCIKCGVWVSLSEKNRFHEFDGMPHHCTARQARPKGTLL